MCQLLTLSAETQPSPARNYLSEFSGGIRSLASELKKVCSTEHPVTKWALKLHMVGLHFLC